MSRSLGQRPRPASILLALGLLGLGPGSAEGSVRLVVSNELRALVLGETSQRLAQSPGATIRIVTVGEVEVVAEESPGRQIVFPGVDGLVQQVPIAYPRAGGSILFGRRNFVWLDEDGNQIAWDDLHVNDISDREIVGVFPPVLPGQYFPGASLELRGFRPRTVGPARPVLWLPGTDDVLPPEPRVVPRPPGPIAIPYIQRGGGRLEIWDSVFPREGTQSFDVSVDSYAPQLSWSMLAFLLWNRFCARVAVAGCVDPSSVGLAPPSFGTHLAVDRLRIKTRKDRAKLRASGSLDFGEAPVPDDGSFSISVGTFFASIPLEDFERRGSHRVWRGRSEGLARVVLRDDGTFRVLARTVAADLLGGDVLPVFVQIGGGLAAIRVPLD